MLKKNYFYFAVILFFSFDFSLAQEKVIIPLGRDCGGAGYLRTFGLRKVAYPLDWLVTDDFIQVCRLIEEQFIYFLTPEFLQFNHNRRGVINTRYNIEFIHDFPTLESGFVAADDGVPGNIPHNFLDHVQAVKNKYQPRINRFFKTLNGDLPVIFLRTHITPAQAQIFIDLMSKEYPNLKYILAIFHKYSDPQYEWNMNNVVNFYISPDQPNQTNDWYKGFIQLGLIDGTNYRTISSINWVNADPIHIDCCK